MADETEAYFKPETVEGVVQCYSCDYWGTMVGYIEGDNRKIIQFVCPECQAIESVANVYGA